MLQNVHLATCRGATRFSHGTGADVFLHNTMNVLSLVQKRAIRSQLRCSAQNTIARGSETVDNTSAHLSPTRLTASNHVKLLTYRGVAYKA